MLSTGQKMRANERKLQDLTLCGNPINVPGNFLAQQRRRKHDDSKLVFPATRKVKMKAEHYKTNYSLDFRSRSNGRPSSPRPCSPTRRNNPHPSQNFLTWRIPTRIFNYGKLKNANVSFLNSNIDDTLTSFYEDYAGRQENPNAVDTKMLLELTKNYTGAAAQKRERIRKGTFNFGVPTTGTSSQEILLPNLLRQSSWLPNRSSLGLIKKHPKKSANLSPVFVKPELQPLFQSWYDVASSRDKETTESTVAQMEENYIQKALQTALKPDAIEAIEDWLLTADEEEREIAMQFIRTILLHSLDKNNKMNDDTRAEKARQDSSMLPTSRASTPTSRASTPTSRASTPLLTKHHHHHHHHHMKKGCDVCSKKELEAVLQQLQSVASIPQDVPGITEFSNPLHTGDIAQKEARKHFLQNRKVNRPKKGQSLIETSQKPKARILQSTLNSTNYK